MIKINIIHLLIVTSEKHLKIMINFFQPLSHPLTRGYVCNTDLLKITDVNRRFVFWTDQWKLIKNLIQHSDQCTTIIAAYKCMIFNSEKNGFFIFLLHKKRNKTRTNTTLLNEVFSVYSIILSILFFHITKYHVRFIHIILINNILYLFTYKYIISCA